MAQVKFKYKVGDIVKFKEKFGYPASCGLKQLAGTLAQVEECKIFGGPCYKLCGMEQFFVQTCFEGTATEAEFLAQQALENQACMQQPTATTCDTGDSGEFEVLPLEEAKWYRISFSAKLTPDDLRAMKKCFFDAMNESMEIYDLEGLEIKEA